MKHSLHAIINSLHQISAYASLLKNHPERVAEYTKQIENTVYSIDAELQELFQTNHPPSSHPYTGLDTNVAKGKCVLVVDDMSENRNILVEIFQTLHCNVKSASGGVEALDIAKSFAPDIICMDILMPGMDGYQTASALRDAGCTATLIAVSALKEDVSKSVFDAWLFKPFTADQIISLLASQNLTDKKTKMSTIDFSSLTPTFRNELLSSVEHGALSRSEKLVETLDESECKAWLSERLSVMDFNTIRNSILDVTH